MQRRDHLYAADWLRSCQAIAEHSLRSRQSAEQTVVWLAGLNAALAALLASHSSVVDGTGLVLMRWAVGMFGVSIVSCVLYRALSYIVGAVSGTQHLVLEAILSWRHAREALDDDPVESWTAADYARRLTHRVGPGFDFIAEMDDEEARHAYEEEIELLREFEDAQMKSISRLVSHAFGNPVTEYDPENRHLIRRARFISRLHSVGSWVFVLALVGFLAGVVLAVVQVTS